MFSCNRVLFSYILYSCFMNPKKFNLEKLHGYRVCEHVIFLGATYGCTTAKLWNYILLKVF